MSSFNTQPPEGGWDVCLCCRVGAQVSTHSRLKAAGFMPSNTHCFFSVSTHSRLKAAGTECLCLSQTFCVSTHSRLKAAGRLAVDDGRVSVVSTHSRLKAAGIGGVYCSDRRVSFNTQPPEGGWQNAFPIGIDAICFNTQPPEGGWTLALRRHHLLGGFNTQPPEGGWMISDGGTIPLPVSTHSRLKAAGASRHRARCRK